MNPVKFSYAKPIYGAVIAFLTGLAAAVTDDTVTASEWISIVIGTVVAAGAIFGVTGTELPPSAPGKRRNDTPPAPPTTPPTPPEPGGPEARG